MPAELVRGKCDISRDICASLHARPAQDQLEHEMVKPWRIGSSRVCQRAHAGCAANGI